ncbi:MAG: thymidine kinase [Patescibacteria group bacterium]|nr:thymidine kinase [Patescibacteria group bacterium]
MAKLHFKYGAMNSGKSDTLIKTAFNYTERGLNVLTVKPAIDTKGEAKIVARGGHERIVDILAHEDTNLEKEVLAHSNVAVILVDESQFLSEDQIGQLFRLAKNHDISVICYGLRADFKTKMFPGSKRLFEIADNLEKLPTMCFCGSQAEFNTRKVDGVYIFEGNQVAIDGESAVDYDSLCGKCYQKEGGHI